MRFLYHDEVLAVILKEAGELSEAGRGGEAGVPDLIGQELGCPVYPVHRLDRQTAGVMVYALTRESAAALSEEVRAGVFQKEYLAVLQGVPEESEGDLRDLLFFDRRRNKSFVVKRMRAGVKEARLSYRVAAVRESVSLVQIRLQTGRTHQIRVQFASRKTPLYGDAKYGGTGRRTALFCRRITFMHPITKKDVSFVAEPDRNEPWNLFPPPDQILKKEV